MVLCVDPMVVSQYYRVKEKKEPNIWQQIIYFQKEMWITDQTTYPELPSPSLRPKIMRLGMVNPSTLKPKQYIFY